MKRFLAATLFCFTFLLSATVVAGQKGDSPTPLTFSSPTYPQDIRFDYLTTDDGLSSNQVLTILQDSDGFMWFGTFNGLNKYDGKTVTIYSADPDDPNSISSNIVRDILEDRHGILWIATSNGGLNRFDPATQTFTHYLQNPDDPDSLSDNNVEELYEDSAGGLWVGTKSRGLEQFDPVTETFTHYPPDAGNPNSIGGATVSGIAEDGDGELWIATSDGGVSRLDRETGQFTNFQYDPDNPNSMGANQALSVYRDLSGGMWFGTLAGGLNQLESGSEESEEPRFIRHQHDPDDDHSISANDVGAILEDRTGTFWIDAGSGIDIFERDSGRIAHYEADPDKPASLSSNRIVDIYEDRSGIVWIATFGGGVNKYNPATQHDSVSQALFSASIIAETTPVVWRRNPDDGRRNLEKLRLMTKGALAEMRTLLLELRSDAVVQLPLSQLLATLADSTLGRSRIPVDLVIEGDCAPPDDVKVALYRVAQEALTNVAKHAQATEATLTLTCSDSAIILTVQDNGCGFNPDKIEAGHFGLAIMAERLAAIDGTLVISSVPGQGTKIVATGPDIRDRPSEQV